MGNSQVIKGTQRSACKVAKFRMVAFGLELTDYSDRNNYFMFFEF
jgi:hypothetical protein